MTITSAKFTVAQRSLWHRIRFQLGIGLLLAVLLPYLVRYQVEAHTAGMPALNNSLVATSLALIAGYYSFRKVSQYPGVRASYHILPTFAGTYGIMLAIFFFLRLDYSRLHFLSSFGLAVFWYYIVYSHLQRRHRLTIAVVPYGEVDHLFEIGGVEWVRLVDPAASNLAVDAIVADLRSDIPDAWERCLADEALAGRLVMHVKQMEESLTGRVAIDHLSENTFGSLIPGIVYGKVKRVWDVLLCLAVIPVLLLPLLLLALAIKLDSRGPVFFRQTRMGFRGETFHMVKFRSMRAAGDVVDARKAAMTQDDDARVTRIGRVIRRYRIDELPQILNILKGEMSWIGPRPEAVPLSLWYEAELPFYRYRHIVRPGITGWAQVNQGHVADVSDVLWKLQYDFYYIRNFSSWLDLLIVARTIRTILTGFGAR